MQFFSCQVAIAGDIRNKAHKPRVSVGEIKLMQYIHGENTVTDIRPVDNPRVSHVDERERLNMTYPKYQRLIDNIYRDNGGKFPTDIRDLRLSSECFANESTVDFDTAEALEELEAADGDSEEEETA